MVSEFLPCFLGDNENKSKVTGGLIKIIINQVIHLDKVLAVKPPPPSPLLSGSTSTIKKSGNLILLKSKFLKPEDAWLTS